MANNNNNSNEIIIPSVEELLNRAFEELRISEIKIRKDALGIMKKASDNTANPTDLWLDIMKAIVMSCETNHHSFSKSELCDFLTIGAKGLDFSKEGQISNAGGQPPTRLIDDAILSIYRDIMENYDNSNETLKSNYPKLILNIASIVHKGTDLNGDRVGVYGLERYYQRNKSSAVDKILSLPVILDNQSHSITKEDDSVPEKERTEIIRKSKSESHTKAHRKELTNSLSVLTQRKKKELDELLMKIPDQDYKKIADLCINYSKLQKYSKLVGTKEFSPEIERELGRKLTDRQLQHATISIRKVKIYIENVLDGKFLPHGSHGINHVKHNLEYGYQLMGLIKYRRRKHEPT